ncbi:ATP-dependent sacrificial sulfur transferase LarE [candidate division TA06 bacterium]|uniref:ATP-dependent sacrificial sulfur transferase LarE n=1 Tax=candidate division TA06 bacterium TaxID=2250710 RepID=A0A933IC47_UNCT6|nr:ATP-dependent sacrificial sulfur transferase LarE [candidate division TA06 bacterium]
MNLQEKENKLKGVIAQFDSAVIAFSGGVDSTFLARICRDILKGKVLLVTASSSTYPAHELEDARKLAAGLGMEHLVIVSEELDIPGFRRNPPDRCYHCKRELFLKIRQIAEKEGCEAVFDGSNADDQNDYRPGRRAIEEQGIISPLCLSGLTKPEIRELSRSLGLTTAEKPPYACLASRFPYGEEITRQKLDRVAEAEKSIRNLGFTLFRVRSHGNLARLEFCPVEMGRAWEARESLLKICHATGFIYVAFDMLGYRTGAMNEVLLSEK